MRSNFFQFQKMSLRIIKAGILDTIQDAGRFGFQNIGINTGGMMDGFSGKLANCLLGKDLDSPVIELHFPASVFEFCEASVISITGADFSARIDEKPVALHRPITVNKGSVLQFTKVISGCRCYISVIQNFDLPVWLNSYSTNLKANAGGLGGRVFISGDVIPFEKRQSIETYISAGQKFDEFSWFVKPFEETATADIEVIAGPDWNWMSEESQEKFCNNSFNISTDADRMGYRLKGPALKLKEQQQLVSSGVSFGTIQLLPSGQLIVLMADHQTTGGYPRVATVISAHLSALAQKKPNEKITFKITDIAKAEQKLLQQYHYLLSVQHASSLKLKSLFS
jgi:antagonist of KipI